MHLDPHLFLSFSLKPMLGLAIEKDLCKSLAQKLSTKFCLDSSPREERQRGEGEKKKKIDCWSQKQSARLKTQPREPRGQFWAFLYKCRQNAEVFCPAFGLHLKLRGTVWNAEWNAEVTKLRGWVFQSLWVWGNAEWNETQRDWKTRLRGLSNRGVTSLGWSEITGVRWNGAR